MADLRNPHSTRWLSRLQFLLFVTMMFTAINGCEKPPTFNELIGNEEKKNETPQTKQTPSEPLTQSPTPEKKFQPKKPDAQQVIAEFMKLRPHEITDQHLAVLAALTEGKESITKLNLGGSKVTPNGFQKITEFPALTDLSLIERQLTDGEMMVIADVPQLEILHLERTGVNDRTLGAIANSTNLKYLNLNFTAITDAGFVHLKKLTKLETLHVHGTQINGKGFKVISGFNHMKDLSAGQSRFAEFGFQHIKSWGTLESLSLYQAGLTDQVLNARKVSFTKYKNLKVLNLSYNDITNLSMKRLAGMKNLEKLFLRNNPGVNGGGMSMLKASKNLQHVDLEQTGCNQAAVTAMLQFYQKYNSDFQIYAFGKINK